MNDCKQTITLRRTTPAFGEITLRASIAFLVLLSTFPLQAQKFVIDKGEISFSSNASLEMIKAVSDKVSGLIDPANNQFAFLVNIQSFKGFNSELQRQHFNENYMESEKYPKATFSGKIIEQIDFSRDSTYEVRAKGDLDIHGQKQSRIIKSRVTIHHGQLTIETQFVVPLTDHLITIPKIVSQKIATEIVVHFRASLLRQK
jgi:polyisoprenoid-binding protein YceI